MNKNLIEVLHGNLSSDGYQLPDIEEFKINLQDENLRQSFYNNLTSDGYDFGSYEDFSNTVAPSSQPTKPLLPSSGQGNLGSSNSSEGTLKSPPNLWEGVKEFGKTIGFGIERESEDPYNFETAYEYYNALPDFVKEELKETRYGADTLGAGAGTERGMSVSFGDNAISFASAFDLLGEKEQPVLLANINTYINDNTPVDVNNLDDILDASYNKVKNLRSSQVAIDLLEKNKAYHEELMDGNINRYAVKSPDGSMITDKDIVKKMFKQELTDDGLSPSRWEEFEEKGFRKYDLSTGKTITPEKSNPIKAVFKGISNWYNADEIITEKKLTLQNDIAEYKRMLDAGEPVSDAIVQGLVNREKELSEKDNAVDVNDDIRDDLYNKGAIIEENGQEYAFYNKNTGTWFYDNLEELNNPKVPFSKEYKRPHYIQKINLTDNHIAEEDRLSAGEFYTKTLPSKEGAKLIPFAGQGFELSDAYKLYDVSMKLKNDQDIDEEDLVWAKEYVDKLNRDNSFGYDFWKGVASSGQFMAELYFTAGAFTATKEVTEAGLKQAFAKWLKESAEDQINVRLAKLGGKTFASSLGLLSQTTVMGAGRSVSKTLGRQTPDAIIQGDSEEYEIVVDADSEIEPIWKGYGEQLTENLSERAGTKLMQTLKLPVSFATKKGRAQSGLKLKEYFGLLTSKEREKLSRKALKNAVLKSNPELGETTIESATKKFFKQSQVGTFSEELLEEQYGKFIKDITGIEEFVAPTPDDVLLELSTLAFPQALRKSITEGGKGYRKAKAKSDLIKDLELDLVDDAELIESITIEDIEQGDPAQVQLVQNKSTGKWIVWVNDYNGRLLEDIDFDTENDARKSFQYAVDQISESAFEQQKFKEPTEPKADNIEIAIEEPDEDDSPEIESDIDFDKLEEELDNSGLWELEEELTKKYKIDGDLFNQNTIFEADTWDVERFEVIRENYDKLDNKDKARLDKALTKASQVELKAFESFKKNDESLKDVNYEDAPEIDDSVDSLENTRELIGDDAEEDAQLVRDQNITNANAYRLAIIKANNGSDPFESPSEHIKIFNALVLDGVTEKVKEDEDHVKLAKILSDKVNALYSMDGNLPNYTNNDIEVTLSADLNTGNVAGEQQQGDVMLDFIGSMKSEGRGKGNASKELDRILAEADKLDMSMTLLVDSDEATRNISKTDESGFGKGLSDDELITWYKKRGFLFDRGSKYGYRPKKSNKKVFEKQFNDHQKNTSITIPLKDIDQNDIEFLSDPSVLDPSLLKDGQIYEAGNNKLYLFKDGYVKLITNLKHEVNIGDTPDVISDDKGNSVNWIYHKDSDNKVILKEGSKDIFYSISPTGVKIGGSLFTPTQKKRLNKFIEENPENLKEDGISDGKMFWKLTFDDNTFSTIPTIRFNVERNKKGTPVLTPIEQSITPTGFGLVNQADGTKVALKEIMDSLKEKADKKKERAEKLEASKQELLDRFITPKVKQYIKENIMVTPEEAKEAIEAWKKKPSPKMGLGDNDVEMVSLFLAQNDISDSKFDEVIENGLDSVYKPEVAVEVEKVEGQQFELGTEVFGVAKSTKSNKSGKAIIDGYNEEQDKYSFKDQYSGKPIKKNGNVLWLKGDIVAESVKGFAQKEALKKYNDNINTLPKAVRTDARKSATEFNELLLENDKLVLGDNYDDVVFKAGSDQSTYLRYDLYSQIAKNLNLPDDVDLNNPAERYKALPKLKEWIKNPTEVKVEDDIAWMMDELNVDESELDDTSKSSPVIDKKLNQTIEEVEDEIDQDIKEESDQLSKGQEKVSSKQKKDDRDSQKDDEGRLKQQKPNKKPQFQRELLKDNITIPSKGKDGFGRDIPDWRGAEVYHSTDLEGYEDITKNGYKLVSEGYYGMAVSFTPNLQYSKQFGDRVTVGKLSNDIKILNLNDPADWETFQSITGRKSAQDYPQLVLDAGYDGVYDVGAGDLFIYNPKVVTARKTPQKQYTVQGNLVVLHNFSSSRIEDVEMLGGLPVPSIAITDKEIPFNSFGDVTLVGDMDLINPESPLNEVYDSDIYSKTVPLKLYDVDENALSDRLQKMRTAFETVDRRVSSLDPLGGADLYRVQGGLEFFLQEAKYNRGLQYQFLLDQGINIRLFKRNARLINQYAEATPLRNFFQKYPNLTQSNIEIGSEVHRELTDAIKNSITTYYTNKNIQKILLQGFNDRLDSKGFYAIGSLGHFFTDSKNVGKKVVDTERAEKSIEKALKKVGNDKFYGWVESTFSPYFSNPHFKDGKRKVEWDMDNIVNYMMKGGTTSRQEGMTYSFGRAKSDASKRLKSLDEIRQATKNLTTAKGIKDERESFNELFSPVFDRVNPYYKWDSTWESIDNLNRALGQYNKGKRRGVDAMRSVLKSNDFIDVPSGLIEDIIPLADMMRRSKIQYLEAKPQRAVNLSEFRYAIVPKKTSRKKVDILRKNGVVVKYYDPKKENDRSRVLQKLKKVHFQKNSYVEDVTSIADNDWNESAENVLTKAVGGAKVVYLSNEEMNEEVRKREVDSQDDLELFHGSPHRFDKFTLNKIGTGANENVMGWGLYFTSSESLARHYATHLTNVLGGERNLYKVTLYKDKIAPAKYIALGKEVFLSNLPKNKQDDDGNALPVKKFKSKESAIKWAEKNNEGEYNWLDSDKAVKKFQLKRLQKHWNNIKDSYDEMGSVFNVNQIETLDKTLSQTSWNTQWGSRSKSGEALYTEIQSVLGSRGASKFLLNAGIDGITFMQSQTLDNAPKGRVYVVFDDTAIKIEERIQFQKTTPEKLRVDQVAKKVAGRKVREAGRVRAGTVQGLSNIMDVLADENFDFEGSFEWYRDKVFGAVDIASIELPELRNNSSKQTIFKVLMGITSLGTKVSPNYDYSVSAMRYYLDNGKLEIALNVNGNKVIKAKNKFDKAVTVGALKSSAVGTNALKLQKLIDELGEDGAVDWLMSTHTGKEINEKFGKNFGHLRKGYTYYGMMAFGQKIGRYILNLDGVHDEAVYDLWWSRTWNRWMGTPFKTNKSGKVEKDSKGRPVTQETPRTVVEVDVMDEVVNNLVKELSDMTGFKWSPDQVQAVLWYYEKELYIREGSAQEEGTNYKDQAIRRAKERNYYEQFTTSKDTKVAGGTKGVRGSVEGEQTQDNKGDQKSDKGTREGTGQEDSQVTLSGVQFQRQLSKPQQWVDYFQETTVIDDKGNPLVVYHITDNVFDEFIYKEGGFHFGTEDIHESLRALKGSELNIKMEGYLDIRNPIRLDDMGNFDALDIANKLLEKNILTEDQWSDLEGRLVEPYESDNPDYQTEASNILNDFLLDLGYDGFVYKNSGDTFTNQPKIIVDAKNMVAYVSTLNTLSVMEITPKKDGSKNMFAFYDGSNVYEPVKDLRKDFTKEDLKNIKGLLDNGYEPFNPYTGSNLPVRYDDFVNPKALKDSWIAFKSSQFKLTSNQHPTTDPKVQYQGQEEGSVLGFFDQESGTIYINKDKATKDTIFHEFTHPYINWIRENDSERYNEGIELIKQSPYLDMVKMSQPSLSPAEMLDEALVQAIGEQGARIKNAKDKNKFLAWIKKLFMQFKRAIKKFTGEKLTLDEFTDSVAQSLQAGKELFELESKAGDVQYESGDAPVFYSSTRTVIADKFPEKMKKVSVKNWLKRNQIKQEEIDWLDLDTIFDNDKNQYISKGELYSWVTVNEINVETVMKGYNPNMVEAVELFMENHGHTLEKIKKLQRDDVNFEPVEIGANGNPISYIDKKTGAELSGSFSRQNLEWGWSAFRNLVGQKVMFDHLPVRENIDNLIEYLESKKFENFVIGSSDDLDSGAEFLKDDGDIIFHGYNYYGDGENLNISLSDLKKTISQYDELVESRSKNPLSVRDSYFNQIKAEYKELMSFVYNVKYTNVRVNWMSRTWSAVVPYVDNLEDGVIKKTQIRSKITSLKRAEDVVNDYYRIGTKLDKSSVGSPSSDFSLLLGRYEPFYDFKDDAFIDDVTNMEIDLNYDIHNRHSNQKPRHEGYVQGGASDDYTEVLLRIRKGEEISGGTDFGYQDNAGHWEEDNVIAHARMNTRYDSNGNKILFIEEIQSDWHQEGASEGYIKRIPEDIKNKIDALNLKYDAIKRKRNMFKLSESAEKQSGEDRKKWIELDDRMEKVLHDIVILEKPYKGAVLDAPFKSTAWIRLILKRLIRHGAENGYDGISWTTGAQQIDRWQTSMRQNIDAFHWNKYEENGIAYVKLNAIKNRSSVGNFNIPINGKAEINGRQVSLERLVGKETAKEIVESDTKFGVKESSNLSIGGGIHKLIYDKAMIDIANKLGKRFGVKVATNKIITDSFSGVLWSKNIKDVGYGLGQSPIVVVASPTETMYKNDLKYFDARNYNRIFLTKKGAEKHIKDNKNSDIRYEIVEAGTEHPYLELNEDLKSFALKGQPLFQKEIDQPVFPDTKVVDSDGKPLVVYHGTAYDFNNLSGGNWFAEDVSFANDWMEKDSDMEGANPRIISANINITNPVIIPEDLTEITSVDEWISRLSNLMNVSQADLDVMPEAIKSAIEGRFSRVPKKLTNWEVLDSIIYADNFIDWFKGLGYDGFDTYETGQRTWYAFESDQIKELKPRQTKPRPQFRKTLVESKEGFVNKMAKLYQALSTSLGKPASKKQFIDSLNEMEYNEDSVKRAQLFYSQIKNKSIIEEGETTPIEKDVIKLEDKITDLDEIIVSSEDRKVIKESRKKIVKIRQRIKSLVAGERIGSRATKIELRKLKMLITRYAKENLPKFGATRGQISPILTSISNAKNEKQLEAVFNRIDNIRETVYTKMYLSKIKKALKSQKLKKQGGKIKGKLTADTQEYIEKIKNIVTMSQLEADEQLFFFAELEESGKMDSKRQEDKFLIEVFGGLKSKSLEEIEEAYANLLSIIDSGKTLRLAMESLRKTKNKLMADRVVSVILPKGKEVHGKLSRRTLGRDTSKTTSQVWDIVRGVNAKIQSFETMLDIFSYNDRGSIPFDSYLNRKFGKSLRNADLKEQEGVRLKEVKLMAKAQEIFGLSGRALKKKLDKNEMPELVDVFVLKEAQPDRYMEIVMEKGETIQLKLSQNELAQYWMWLQDETLHGTFKNMGFTPDTLSQIEEALDPQVLEFAQYLLDDFYPSYYPDINKVYRKMFYVNMNNNPKYSHIVREHYGSEEDTGETLNTSGAIPTAFSGHLIARVDNKKPLQPTDMVRNVFQHIFQMEHFISHAEAIREIRAVFNSSDVQATLEEYYGIPMMQVFNNLLDDVARGGLDRNKIVKEVDFFIRNFVRAKIGLKPVIFLKQLASIPASMSEIPVHSFIYGTGKFFLNPKKALGILRESRLVKSRGKGFSRDVRELLRKSSSKRLADSKGFNEFSMSLARLGDISAILVGGYAVYDYHYNKQIESGATEKEAKDFAMDKFEQSAERWQQSGQTKNLSELQRSGSLMKLFTMFLNSPIQYFQQGQTGLRNLIAKRGSKAQNLKRTFMAYFVLNASFQFISAGFKADDEDFWKRLSLAWSKGIPVLGGVVEYLAFRKFGYSMTPLESVVPDLGRAIDSGEDMVSALGGKEEFSASEYYKMADNILDVVGSFTGVPYEGVSGTIEGVYDAFAGNTAHPIKRSLGFSDYALHGTSNKSQILFKESLDKDLTLEEYLNKLELKLEKDGKSEKSIKLNKSRMSKRYKALKEAGVDDKWAIGFIELNNNDDKAKYLKGMLNELPFTEFKKYYDIFNLKSKLISNDLKKLLRSNGVMRAIQDSKVNP